MRLLKKHLLSTDLKQEALPHLPDVEASVLGALLIDESAFYKVSDSLKAERFYLENHQTIYRAVEQLAKQSEPINLLAVVQQLRRTGSLEAAGGAAYLAKLTNHIVSARHVLTHAHILNEYAIRRALITTAQQIQAAAYDRSIDTFDLLKGSEEHFFQIGHDHMKRGYAHLSDFLKEALLDLEKRHETGQELIGIPTGFHQLDQLILGLQPADFIVVAARPGMGKTAFMLSLLAHVALKEKQPVAFFSLEMSSLQLTNRLLSAQIGVSGEKIKRGHLPPKAWSDLRQKTKALGDAPIFIDDTAGLSLLEFKSKCQRLKATRGVRLVIVDYLQLMHTQLQRKSGTREQEIAAISSGLKQIAKELNLTIVSASQLSRAVEARGGDKRPILSDLRESGAIEQDVDIALLLYRPEYYGIMEDQKGQPTYGLAEIIVAKHRNGPLGTIFLRYDPPTTRFSNFSQKKTDPF